MRRTLSVAVSLAFASTLLATSPASAGPAEPPPHSPECPAPVMVEHYGRDVFAVSVSLLASGCPEREERQFSLWLSVSRYDDMSARGATRAVLCGPFPPSSASYEPTYSCEVDLGVDHPQVEEATYFIDVTYPAPEGQETFGYELVCVSDQTGAACHAPGDGQ